MEISFCCDDSTRRQSVAAAVANSIEADFGSNLQRDGASFGSMNRGMSRVNFCHHAMNSIPGTQLLGKDPLWRHWIPFPACWVQVKALVPACNLSHKSKNLSTGETKDLRAVSLSSLGTNCKPTGWVRRGVCRSFAIRKRVVRWASGSHETVDLVRYCSNF